MAWRHTSIIYVHGVGNPKRHVSLSNFLDYFDLYGQTQNKEGVGKPRKFQTIAEKFHNDVIHYVEFKKVNIIDGRPVTTKTVRVYEAYWVPEALTKFGLGYLVLWIAIRLKAPLLMAFSSWRSFSALRLATLHRIGLNYDKPGRLEKLERFYRDFDNWEGRSRYKSGSFKQFLLHIDAISSPQDKVGLQESATLWRSRFQREVLSSFLTTLSFVIGILWLFGLALHALKTVYSSIKTGSLNFTVEFVVDSSFLMILVSVGAYGLSLLSKYVFDVAAWTMESEKDQRFAARRKVVGFTQKLIRHVVYDSNCGEVHVVAHSLGTSVAMEAIFKEGELAKIAPKNSLERIAPNLAKIRTIFLTGSPIDLIFSYFQADRTFSHRYNRLYEDKRPSIGLPPFWIDGKAATSRIYNFWSRFDPISSTVLSVRKKLSERRDALVNSECLPPGAPLPLRAHVSYFADPSVMGAIYRAVMLGELPDPAIAHHPPRLMGFGRRANIVFGVAFTSCITWTVLFHEWIVPLGTSL